LLVLICAAFNACGPSTEQRAAAISFGRSLQDHGRLITEETTYVRSEVKAMRVLALSLPNAQSAALFDQGGYKNLAIGLPEPKIQQLVKIGGAAETFGESLAKVADLTSSTSEEQIFSAATRQLVQVAGAIGKAASGVSVGAPTINLVSFTLTEHYRLRYLEQALPGAEPAFRSAQKDVSAEFDPEDSNSLLFTFVAATNQLTSMLQASDGLSDTSGDRQIIANGYRLVMRNRDHIQYVTSREQELAQKAAAAYDAMMDAFKGDDTRLAAVSSYSSVVFEVSLAFESLK
jgi:hypothetical protein